MSKDRIKDQDLKPEQYHNTRVCSDHFLDVSPSHLYDENNPDWSPSLKLGCETSSLGKRSTEGYKRAADRMVKKTARMDDTTDIRVDDHFIETEDCPQEGSSPVHLSLLKENLQMLVLKYKPT